jgi:hypothetical protein
MNQRTMWHSAIGCLVTLTLGLLTAPLAADAQPADTVCVPDDVTSPTDRVRVLLGTALVIVRNAAMDIELHSSHAQRPQQILITNHSGWDVAVQIQPAGAGPPADAFSLSDGATEFFTPPTGEEVQFWVVTIRLFCAES